MQEKEKVAPSIATIFTMYAVPEVGLKALPLTVKLVIANGTAHADCTESMPLTKQLGGTNDVVFLVPAR